MAIHKMAPPVISHKERIQKSSVIGWVQDYCPLVLWITDYCGCDVEVGESQLRGLSLESERSKEAFITTATLQKSNWILFQHDNARQHTCLNIRGATRKCGWTVVHQSAYSPHPARLVPFIICNCCNFGVYILIYIEEKKGHYFSKIPCKS
jgi:hypothetical protein